VPTRFVEVCIDGLALNEWQCDLARRVVKEGQARMWAEAKGFHYFETSAESGLGIQELFVRMLELAVPMAIHEGTAARASMTFSQEDLNEVQRSVPFH
jgi:DnaJ family protein C protein 27